MTGRAARAAAGSRRALAAGAALTALLLAGCATGDPAPGTASHPCDGGAPETIVLTGGGFGDGPPPPEAQAWQQAASGTGGELTALAGDRLGALWLDWAGEQMVVTLTPGPEIPALHAAAEAAEVDVDVRYTATIGRDALVAVLTDLYPRIGESGIPGVASAQGDELNGRLVFSVASGDDGGAAICTALAQLLRDEDVRVPYAFEVFEGPVDGRQRIPVAVSAMPGGASDRTSRFVEVIVSSCNGEPEVTRLEQTADEVRVEVTSSVPAPGWGGNDCLDQLTVELDEPLGDRPLVDLTSGQRASSP